MPTRRGMRLFGLLALLIVASVALSACGATPGAQADEFARFVPEEYNAWRRNERDTVRLRSNTILAIGHITMIYEGPDDATAYIVIEVHPTEDAAQVAATTRLREWHMQGLALDADRAPQQATADVAQTDRARYALLREGTTVIEIDAIAAEGEAPISDEAFGDLLFMARNAFTRVAES